MNYKLIVATHRVSQPPSEAYWSRFATETSIVSIYFPNEIIPLFLF